MIVLQAPHELIVTTTVLPSPLVGDDEAPTMLMQLNRAIDGTIYTQDRTVGRTKFTYTWTVTRVKAIELIQFVNTFYTKNIRLTNHKNEVWVVNVLTDPNEITIPVRGEFCTVRLELEGSKLP